MDSGIHDDQNFYARRPLAQSPERHQQQQDSLSDPSNPVGRDPSLPRSSSPSSEVPPTLPFLTTANLQAVTSNGFDNGLSAGLDPDDFYRQYTGPSQLPNGYPDLLADEMATKSSNPRHPTVAVARTSLKAAHRSVSEPLNDKIALASSKAPSALNGISQYGKPSVKDLLKRFDQNNEPAPSVITRKPAPRLAAAKDSPVSSVGNTRYRAGSQARSTTTSQPNSPPRAGPPTRSETIPNPAAASRLSFQRSRTTSEEQDPQKPLSITTHASHPKNAAPSNITQAAKSMTSLPPTSSRSALSPIRKPLFGEIIPLQGRLETGYGIPQTPRQTSDPNLCSSPASLEDKSAHGVCPSSPTAWYLGVTPALEDVDHNKHHDASTSHNQDNSNAADRSLNSDAGDIPGHESTTSPTAQMHEVSRSRLPISTKRLSSQSGSSSPTSPVSNSAGSTKTHVIARRKPDQNSWNTASAGRSMTPTTRTTPPKTTASPPRLSPRRARVPERLNTNSSSLKAYISSPPPKTSPPLRSSRPRQPISSASATDASGSPRRVQSAAQATRGGETGDRKPPRNIQPTPADFAAHRARIQRAYTKSIHENEQREIRAANLRRLNERHAKAEAEKEAAREASRAAAENAAREAENENLERDVAPPDEEPPATDATPAPLSSPRQSLQITTSFRLPDKETSLGEQDSPTLGMPGQFLDDDEPASAVTDATATTEFDNEQQTEAPQLSSSSIPTVQHSTGMMSSSMFQWGDLSVEQATYGIRHSLSMTPNSADASGIATPIEDYQQEHTPTKDLFIQDLAVPGTYKHDLGEYNPDSFAGRVTSPSPKRTPPPPQSRTATPLKSIGQINVDESDDTQQPGTSQIHPPPRILLHPEPESADSTNISNPEANLPRVGLNEALNYLRTPSTELGYDSSSSNSGENGSGPDGFDGPYEQGQDVANLPQNNISSQRSSWTNDSVGTTESSGHGEYISPTPAMATTLPEQHSPHAQQQPFVEPSRLESPNRHNMGPALPGDGAFGITFADPAPMPLWPSYAPPPPPGPLAQLDHEPADPSARSASPGVFQRRPPSGFYQQGQSDAVHNTESPRASEDVGSARASLYTPRSSTQISLEGSTANHSFESREILIEATEEEKKAAAKFRKRLFTRRMLIQELIDTEMGYLKDMNVVEEIYKGTAEACPNMEASDIQIIFRNTDELVAFTTKFLDGLRSAAGNVYVPRSQRKSQDTQGSSGTTTPPPEDRFSVAATLTGETDEQKDRQTTIGAHFGRHLKQMGIVYTDFLKNSEMGTNRLHAIQVDGAVKVWLSECNFVAKDLTSAWDLDALLVKPVQRITRYQLILVHIFDCTPEDHPDFHACRVSLDELGLLLKNIDDLKKRIQMVGKIVGRKRNQSDVRTGIAKAFGRRNDKLQAANMARLQEDEEYRKSYLKFGDDFLRLQVVLRDVEYYTRETTTYVNKFLDHLSCIEDLMRVGASGYPELESKWRHFNVSMRNMGTIALEDHIASVRMRVIEPFERVIRLYSQPSVAMKKRNKRRLDYEKYLTLKAQGKKVDDKLQELVDQYEALNEILKHELPRLATLTESIGNVCLVQFIGIQTQWYGIWQEKVRAVLEERRVPKDIADIVKMFEVEYIFAEARVNELGIVNGQFGSTPSFLPSEPNPRTSQSTQSTADPKGRPSNLSSRSRGLSFNSDKSPSIPTPDFEKSGRHSGQFTFSPALNGTGPAIAQFGQQLSSQSNGHSRSGSLTPGTPDPASASASAFGNRSHTSNLGRPNTGRSATSDAGTTRPSNEYNNPYRRESGSTSNSAYRHVDGPPPSSRPFSGIFHSAMPLPDGPEDSQRSSRASSRDRNVSDGYNILYLAASLFEFNISATKSEAGYPYLTYSAGEIFDVIGEKGELWLAKNQDDESNEVGWIWSKHFARLAA